MPLGGKSKQRIVPKKKCKRREREAIAAASLPRQRKCNAASHGQ
jgi:hypothetical protein